eukprot:7881051-Heterocapsa_arctica.AAC.1
MAGLRPPQPRPPEEGLCHGSRCRCHGAPGGACVHQGADRHRQSGGAFRVAPGIAHPGCCRTGGWQPVQLGP